MGARLVFTLIGAEPCTGRLRGSVAPDDQGYVHGGASHNLPETNRPGVLAEGAVSGGSIKRVASAVGDGAMAVRPVHEYLAWTGHVPAR